MNIGQFILYENEPNTICYGGHLFVKEYDFDTLNRFKKRLVRVYLPSNYEFDNPNKRFKVIYMLDGKNIFDDYTSFCGEWGFDEEMEDLIHRGEIEGYIVVGIDAPNDGADRSLEMSPESLVYKERHTKGFKDVSGYASRLGDFIFKEVKKEIDETFYTLSSKEDTVIGGSSMGGISAFTLGLYYNDYVSNVLSYSPAFFLYTVKSFNQMLLDNVDKCHFRKIYLYVGGKDFESVFVKDTFKVYRYLLKHGYTHKEVKLIYDSNAIHNERAWNKYIKDALRFIK